MQYKQTRKILSLLLTVCLMFGMLPMTAVAADNTAKSTDRVITAFDALPDKALWQFYDIGAVTLADLNLAGALTGTDADGNAITINGVTWQSAPAFDPATSAWYYFSPTLPEGYILAEGVTAPVISVFIESEGGVQIQPLAYDVVTINNQTDWDMFRNTTINTWNGDNNTIILKENVTGPLPVPSAVTGLTIYGNGHKIDSGTDTVPTIKISSTTATTLTIDNLNITGTGSGYSGISFYEAADHALIVQGTCNIERTNGGGIFASSNSLTITLEGDANLTATGTSANGIHSSNALNINVDSGTLLATSTGAMGIYCNVAMTITCNGSLTAIGGGSSVGINANGGLTFSGNPTALHLEGGGSGGKAINGTISDGTGLGLNNTANLIVYPTSGGTVTGSIWMNGIPVVDGSQIGSDQSGTGWTWNASTATLTLDSGYSGSDNEIYIECGASDNITLKLDGDVTIDANGFGISVAGIGGGWGGSLTIRAGSHTLTVSGVLDAIQAHDGLAIESGTVVAAGRYGGGGLVSYNGDVAITGSANVTATGYTDPDDPTWSFNGIQADKNVLINTSGVVNITGGKGAIMAEGNVTIESGTVNANGGSFALLGENSGIHITGGTTTTNTTGTANGDIHGDLNVSGSGTQVTVNGDVLAGFSLTSGDLTVSGGNVTVTGMVEGDTTVTGGTVSVNEQIIPPGGTTITTGTYTGIYGNDGTENVPADDTNASNNTLTLGNGTTGPTISDTSAMTVAGGQAPGTTGGSANTNALNISGGTSLGGSGFISIFGGRVLAGSGNADGNTVIINGFTQSNNSVAVYGGRSSGSGNVLNNTVGVNSGNTNYFYPIYGGYANSGNVTGNTATISGEGEIQAVIGGYTVSGNAGGSGAGNTVNITGGSANIANGMTGGNSGNGSSSYNEVHIESGYIGTVGGDVSGGWVSGGSGNAENNIVEINGGIFQSSATVIGGHSTGGAATGNSVIIRGGTIGGDIYGGQTSDGSATGNTVTITTTGKPYQNIYGGHTNWVTTGDLFTGNTLNLHAGNSAASVQNFEFLNFYLPATITNGATMLTSTAAVNLTGVTVNLDFTATVPTLAVGNVITLINNVTGTFTDKNVTVSGYTFTVSVSGGKLIATVTAVPGGNTLTHTVRFYNDGALYATKTVNDGAALGANWPTNPIKSGYRFDGWYTAASGGMEITTATVFNANATVYAHWTNTSSSGGQTIIYPYPDSTLDAGGNLSPTPDISLNGNSVTVNGGGADITGWVFGGWSKVAGNTDNNTVTINGGTMGGVYGGYSESGNSTGNSVVITGGTITGWVVGGYSNSGSANITNNSVTISGSPDLSGAWLMGGNNGSTWQSDNNTLNFNTSGLTISALANFANYNFTLSSSLTNGGTVLTVTDGDGWGRAIDIDETTIGLACNGTPSLSVGNKITLISETGGYGFNGWPTTTSVTASGYTFGIAVENDKLIATVTGVPSGVTTHTVRFYNDGALYATRTVNDGEALGANWPADPVKSGYRFDGWRANIDYLTNAMIILVNVDVHAQWTDIGGGWYPNPDPTPSNPGSTPTTPPNDGKIPVDGDVNGGEIPITQDKATGEVNASLNKADTEKALETAKETGEVVISIPKTNTIDEKTPVSSTVSNDAFKAISDSGAALTIEAPLVSMTFDADAIGTIAGAGEGEVKITAGIADKLELNAKQREAVGNRPVYDFSVTVGGKAIHDFDGTVTISLPYTPIQGEDANAIVIYYIDAQGNVKTIPNGVYDPATAKVTFSTDHFSLFMIGYNLKTFTDVSKNHWAANYVTFVTARGLFNSTSATTFAPETPMTRAMFVLVLANLEGIDLSGYKTSRFSDVPVGQWYAAGVEWAASVGLVSGVGDNKFAPDRNISRQEMAVLLNNYIKYKGYKLPQGSTTVFNDETVIAAWAYDAIKTIQAAGIISGKPGNLYDPLGIATRAEVATILARFVETTSGKTATASKTANANNAAGVNTTYAILPGKEENYGTADNGNEKNT